jgi:uncharacterized membrane protein YuzA (DUF378 family)
MGPLKILSILAQVLVLIGALNWGLVGYFGVDAVEVLLPKGYVRTGYIAVGAAALFLVLARIFALAAPMMLGKI